MMDKAGIKEKIVGCLKKIAPDADPDRLGADENLREKLGLDSFDTLRLIVDISEQLGVEIAEQDYGEITTLNKMTGYLSTRVPGK